MKQVALENHLGQLARSCPHTGSAIHYIFLAHNHVIRRARTFRDMFSCCADRLMFNLINRKPYCESYETGSGPLEYIKVYVKRNPPNPVADKELSVPTVFFTTPGRSDFLIHFLKYAVMCLRIFDVAVLLQVSTRWGSNQQHQVTSHVLRVNTPSASLVRLSGGSLLLVLVGR